MHFPSLRLTRAEVQSRAHRATGQRGYYRLGKGGRDPSQVGPWKPHLDKGKVKGQEIPACDCSGGTAWILGYDRWYDDGTDDGVWFDTSEILRDAKRKTGNKLFRTIPYSDRILPGDVLVYPDAPALGWKQGHVMVVTSILPGFVRGQRTPGKEWWRFVQGVDVSTGRGSSAARYRKHAKLWEDRGGSFVRYLHLVD